MSALAGVARLPRRGRRRPEAWRAGDQRWAFLFIAPQLVGTLFFVLLPLVVALALAFTSWDGLGPVKWTGVANFMDQLTDPLFLRAILNTVLIALITIPVGLTIALLLAIGLNQVRFRAVYLVMIVAPVVTSSVAVAMIWQQLLRSDGFLSTLIGAIPGLKNPDWLTDPHLALVAVCVVIIWSSLGLNVLIFMAGLQTIPEQVLEAARVDGAGPLTMLLRIRLPLLSPTIFFSTVVAMISSLQTFDTVFILTKNGGPDNATRTIVYHIYDLGFRRFELGVSAAASLVLLALTLVVTLVQFRAHERFVHYES